MRLVLHLNTVSPVAVCYHPEVASALLERGVDVVLCGLDDTALSAAVFEARSVGRGRIAVFAGDPAEATEAALAMARELFGGDPVVVSSVAEAPNPTELPGSEPT